MPKQETGKYRLEFGAGGSDTMPFYGKYLEVVPNERIAWTNEEGEEGAVTTVTFEDQGGRTLLNFHEVYPSNEAIEESTTGLGGRIAGADGAAGRIAFQQRRIARVGERIRLRINSLSLSGRSAAQSRH
ncbi:uncharacterized protein YndB with AHSA1/START domain [Rhizobium ruizarguesonis]|jgi:uncharacterized protein YndB with AHSA1/START domain